MDKIFLFVLGVYIGTEIQAWWHRKGCAMFIEWQKRKRGIEK